MTPFKFNFSFFAGCFFSLFFILNIGNSFAAETKKVEINSEKKTTSVISASKLPSVSPGDFLVLKIKKHQKERPKGFFGRQQIIIRDNGKHWLAYIGVGKQMTSGEYIITLIEHDKSTHSRRFMVSPSVYSSESSAGKRYSNLIKRFTGRNKGDSQTQFKLPKSLPWSNIEPTLALDYPARGNWIPNASDNDSTLNNTNNNINLQQDFIRLTTTEAQPIIAPGDAICLAINQETTGFSVWLDHGMGLYSHISGLESVSISEQDTIKAGAAISQIVATNTLPASLEWHVVMNKQLINPHKISQK